MGLSFLYVGMLWGNDYIPNVGIIGVKMVWSTGTSLIVVEIMDKRQVVNR